MNRKTKKWHKPSRRTIKKKQRKLKRRPQHGGEYYVDLDGDVQPVDGKRYKMTETVLNEYGSPTIIYNGHVKAIVPISPPICRESARCEPLPVTYVADGKGLLTVFNEDGTSTSYSGMFKDNMKMGHGIMKYEDGSIYTGNWENDAMSGRGVMKYADGSSYTGHWENDGRSGIGSMEYSDGGSYKGYWENNGRSGIGKIIYADGDTYIGQWKNDDPNGKGKIKFKDKDMKQYEGDFKDGDMNGKGIMLMTNGDQYTGNFVNGYMNGKGIMLNTNGDEYTGDFVNGDMDGKGIMVDSDRRTLYDGYWKDDKPVDLFGRSIYKRTCP